MKRTMRLSQWPCLLVAVALVGSSRAAPMQWTSGPGANAHWYEAIHMPSGIGWTVANAAAPSILAGGYLATITSAEENAFVYSLVDDAKFWYTDPFGTKIGPWLGGTDVAQEGIWEWVTGEPWNYQNWAQGEPNQFLGNDEDYLQFSDYWADPTPRDSTWNDLINSTAEGVRGYIVESTAVPGDYNNDGAVDAADYAVWRNSLGQAVTLPNDTTPGMVTQADYDEWRAHFGQTASSGAAVSANAAVPEPATLLLVLAAVVGSFRLANRR